MLWCPSGVRRRVCRRIRRILRGGARGSSDPFALLVFGFAYRFCAVGVSGTSGVFCSICIYMLVCGVLLCDYYGMLQVVFFFALGCGCHDWLIL